MRQQQTWLKSQKDVLVPGLWLFAAVEAAPVAPAVAAVSALRGYEHVDLESECEAQRVASAVQVLQRQQL